MKKAIAADAIVRKAQYDIFQWTKTNLTTRSIAVGSQSLFKPNPLLRRRRHHRNLSSSNLLCQFVSFSPLPYFRNASTSSDPNNLRRTGLYELHIAKGGKMVPFAGYSMPVQYSDLSVGESHVWTREKASLFDVGHMVQHHISGTGATALLEKITPSSLSVLPPSHSTLSCLLHPVTGGIVDDTVITRIGPEFFYVVTNAACREKVSAYLAEQIEAHKGEGDVVWNVLEGWGLIALQGPSSATLLNNAFGGSDKIDLKNLYFGQCKQVYLDLPGSAYPVPVLVSRGGYTGEDGFELSIPPGVVEKVTEHFLESAGPDQLRLAGLGARDSLRLEAGMCLYGHDLDDSTTPVEAGLSWVVHKDRRIAGGFHGDDVILRQLRPVKDGGGPPRRRVGMIVSGAPAREGAEVVAVTAETGGEAKVIGNVTSGCPSPTLGKNIAMAYIESGNHKAGTEVGVMVRGRLRTATVVKMPFVASKYWKQTAGTAPG
ncbi:Aminomethyltransferase, mitochondrial [Pseudocyphellaria aurata]|nr:Aminomethyltransferase, mitochondrial [Pseudocyphellaria aurata]